MQKETRFIYLSYSLIPSKNANSIHVMKMSEAFNQTGVKFRLIGMKPLREVLRRKKSIFSEYGTLNPFDLKLYPFIRGTKNRLYKIAIIKQLKKFKPTVVYTRSVFLAHVAANATKFDTRIAVELHTELNKNDLIVLSSLVNAQRISKIVCISDALKNRVLSQLHLKNRELVSVLHDGVNLDNYKGAVIPYFTKSVHFTVGYVGHLYPGKGVDFLVDVASKAPNVRFQIVGGKEVDIARIQRLVSQKLLQNIELKGFIPNSKVPSILSTCDVVVMPYQKVVNGSNSRENIANWMSPLKMFEYMASGKLILSSDLKVIREVLDESNSILLSPDDSQEWANTIVRLSDHKKTGFELNRYNNIVDKAKLDVIEYEWVNRAKRILGFFSEN